MLRRSLGRLCLGGKVKEAQAVWSLDFGDRPVTKELNVHHPRDRTAEPMFHVMDLDGSVVNAEHEPALDKAKAVKMMTAMATMSAADHMLLNAQRQGFLSFYMTGWGEEGATVGSMAAVKPEDHVYMQYRETAGLLYRGYTLPMMISQCMGNTEDASKGRQMPIHYGSPSLNHHTISSPLATQIPQAAGAGYAFKLEKADKIVVCFFGDGSASEGDFHAGINHAATTGAQTLFFCRNNGFAISTPTKDQYRGDGILPRGVAYGIPSIRVDGTDVLAVYRATEVARKMIVEEQTPVLIEAMGYRVGDHSTSDDSKRYRPSSEIDRMNDTFNPVARFEKYLLNKGWWGADDTAKLTEETRKLVMSELKRQESVPLYGPEDLFTDTFAVPTPALAAQRDETLAHYERNKDYYAH